MNDDLDDLVKEISAENSINIEVASKEERAGLLADVRALANTQS